MAPSEPKSIETLLRLRREQAEALQAELAEARAEVSLREGRIDQVKKALAEHNMAALDAAEGAAEGEGEGPCAAWPLYRRCVSDLNAVLAENRVRLTEARAVVEQCQDNVASASGEFKAVDRLQADRKKQRDRDAEQAESQEVQDLHAAGRGGGDLGSRP